MDSTNASQASSHDVLALLGAHGIPLVIPNLVLTVLIQIAQDLAAQHGLRGADAVYAAVALQAGCTLISLDNEHKTRLSGIVVVRTPADVLVALSTPPP